jgi:3D (Asp-Asp-Asp) domain-containing protein
MIEGVLLTHYCICEKCCGKMPDHPAYGITASGREAVPYISVAVDPDVIPLGSTVWLVFSDGGRIECRADDTGGAITGARIDLCVSSHREALEHGIDYITVYWEVEEDVSH